MGTWRRRRTNPEVRMGRKTKQKPSVVDYPRARELAVAASVDPRTILKVARGELVKGMPGRRAEKVLREAGLLAAE